MARRKPAHPAALVADRPSARVANGLRLWIAEGRLSRGGRLPSEQVLAARFKVARTTVRAALRQLEEERLVEPSRGRGFGRVVSASALAPRSMMSETVALLTDAGDGALALESPQSGKESAIQVGAIEALRAAGLHALTLQADLLAGDRIQRLIAEKPRGVIAFNAAARSETGQAVLAKLKASGIAVAAYGASVELPAYDRVVSDHQAGCAALTRWLISRGCRRILPVWQLESYDYEHPPLWLAQREAGYREAMAEAGLEPLRALVFRLMPILPVDSAEKLEECTRHAAGYLLDYLGRERRADALMATSDDVVFPVAAACRLLGCVPNRDAAIVGYDNFWMDCPSAQFEAAAPLATVDKFNLRIGEELARVLCDRLEGKLGREAQRRVIAPRLVVTREAETVS